MKNHSAKIFFSVALKCCPNHLKKLEFYKITEKVCICSESRQENVYICDESRRENVCVINKSRL